MGSRICIVTPFYDGIGGVAVAVRQLAREFRQLGHSVDILTRGQTTRVVADDVDADVFRMRLRVPLRTWRSRIGFAVFVPLTLWRLQRFLLAHRIDIVIVQYVNPGHFYLGLLRRLSTWQLFVTFQGDDAHNLERRGAVDRMLYRALLSAADGVIAVASSLARKVAATIELPASRIHVIPNGTPRRLPPLPFEARETRGITVGLLQRRKGIDLILKALAVMRHRGIAQRLMVVGHGEEDSRLAALADAEGVGDLVEFVGAQSHEQTLTLMSMSRYFVLASRAEGLPLVIVEAMMCGLPVIATRVDGVPDVVRHTENGLLVEPEDWRSLADAMQLLATDDERCRAYGEAARQTAASFEWADIAARYLTHCQGAVARDARAARGL